jgi:hypothetical protein
VHMEKTLKELRTACACSAPKTIVRGSAPKGSFQRSAGCLCSEAKKKGCSDLLTYVGTSWYFFPLQAYVDLESDLENEAVHKGLADGVLDWSLSTRLCPVHLHSSRGRLHTGELMDMSWLVVVRNVLL